MENRICKHRGMFVGNVRLSSHLFVYRDSGTVEAR